MNDIVKVQDGVAFTTTLIIAEGVNAEHRAVIKLLDSHLDKNTFSALEMRKRKAIGKGKPTRYAELSETQATFLVTLMKNSPKVVEFKERLSNGFVEVRDQLNTLLSQQVNQQWLEQRQAGKIDRRVETDKIQLFVDYAVSQGSKSAKKYFMQISKMENNALFFVEQKYKNLRDVLDTTELSTIQNADHIVAKALTDGMDDKLHYKEIYKLARDRVLMFAELRGKSPLGYLKQLKKDSV